MEEVNLNFADLYICNDHTAMIEAHYGTEINKQRAEVICSTIELYIKANYATIFNRINSHSNNPLEVAQVLNKNPKVMATAIIDRRDQDLHFPLEERLLDAPSKRFADLSDALFWLEAELDTELLD